MNRKDGSIRSVVRTIECWAGSAIENVCRDALLMAVETGDVVKFKFNDKEVVVDPKPIIASLADQYWLTQKESAE